MTRLRDLFIVLGALSAVGALVFANETPTSIPAAGAACGFGVSAGLCMIAAAIVAVGGRNQSPPAGNGSERAER